MLIETERLRLRKMTRADAPLMLELLNDPAFVRFVGDRGVHTIDQAVHYLEAGPLTSYAQHGFGHYAVELKETGEAIGSCGLRTRTGLEHPDLGYALVRRHWSQGYASEAGRAVIEYARDVLRLPCLLAICSPDNAASVGVLRKLGFPQPTALRLPGEDHDVLLFTLEFSSRDARLKDDAERDQDGVAQHE